MSTYREVFHHPFVNGREYAFATYDYDICRNFDCADKSSEDWVKEWCKSNARGGWVIYVDDEGLVYAFELEADNNDLRVAGEKVAK